MLFLCKYRVAVRLGEHDFNTEIDCETLDGEVSCADPVQDIEIEEIFPHRKFRHQYDDIALIRLSRPANMTPGNQFNIFYRLPRGTYRGYLL